MQTSFVRRWVGRTGEVTQICCPLGTFISSYLCLWFPSESLPPRGPMGILRSSGPSAFVVHRVLSSATALLSCEFHSDLVSHNFESPPPAPALLLIFCFYFSHLAAVIGDKEQGSRRLTEGNTQVLCLLLDLLPIRLLLCVRSPHPHPPTLPPPRPPVSLVFMGVLGIGQSSTLNSTRCQPRVTTPPQGIKKKSAKGQMHHLYSKRKSPLGFCYY